MKINTNQIKGCCLFILFSFSNMLLSQNANLWGEVGLSHNWIFWGRDVELSYTQYFGKTGLKVSLNRFEGATNHRDLFVNFSFYKKGRASNFRESIGFKVGVQRYIQLRDSNLELYPFFSLQYFKFGLKRDQSITNPFLSIDAAVGMLGKVKLYKNFFLQGGANMGFIVFDTSTIYINPLGNRPWDWNLTHAANIGLVYRIGVWE